MKIGLMLTINILFNAVASFLLKIGMSKISRMTYDNMLIISMLKSPYIWLGAIFFGIGFLVYTIILQKIPLSMAYPIVTSGSLILITILSGTILKEVISKYNIFGLALILVGMQLAVK